MNEHDLCPYQFSLDVLKQLAVKQSNKKNSNDFLFYFFMHQRNAVR